MNQTAIIALGLYCTFPDTLPKQKLKPKALFNIALLPKIWSGGAFLIFCVLFLSAKQFHNMLATGRCSF